MMNTMTLSEMVQSALQNADSSIKIASDAETHEDTSLDDIIGIPQNDDPPAAAETASETPVSEPETKSASAMLEDAAYAMKLAEALDNASQIVTEKLASESTGPVDAPGPEVMEAGHLHSKTITPKAQTSTLTDAEKSHGGGPLVEVQGAPNGLQTNKDNYSSLNDKSAALILARAKTASAEQHFYAGDHAAAERLLQEAEQIQAKVAADPSSPQPQAGAPNKTPGIYLDTEPGPASHVPDNAGMASLTKATAKDTTTREAGKYFSEPAKKDNAVAAHVGRTDGQKISSRYFPTKVAEDDGDNGDKEEPKDKPPMTKSESKDDESEEKKSMSQLDPSQLAAARAYLQKQASKITDPSATETEKAAAMEIINTVKNRIGDDQFETLLA